MIRLAHLSDLHLSRSHLPDQLFARVLAGPEDPSHSGYDAVLVAGDVFDRSAGDPESARAFSSFLGELNRLRVPVALIAGNHDAELEVLSRVTLPPNTALLGLNSPETVTWEHLGVAVHGRSIVASNQHTDIAADYPAPIPELVNIGLLHTSLDGVHSRSVCAPTSLSRLQAHGYDYWALGHVHKRRAFAGGRVAYSGSPGGRGRGHDDSKGYYEVTFHAGEVSLDAVNLSDL